eukprot:scaffold10483_cov65-Cyclotella_meneghiniana.AAC.2
MDLIQQNGLWVGKNAAGTTLSQLLAHFFLSLTVIMTLIPGAFAAHSTYSFVLIHGASKPRSPNAFVTSSKFIDPFVMAA